MKKVELLFGYANPKRGERTAGCPVKMRLAWIIPAASFLFLLIETHTYTHEIPDSRWGALWDDCDLEVYIQSFGHAARAEGPENPSPPQSRRDREALECLEGWIFAKLALRHT